jgi:hypothetical protein
MMAHCGVYSIDMKSACITPPVARLQTWNIGSDAVFGGLRSEAETPPPRS